MAYQSRLEIVVDSRTGERNLRRLRGEIDRTDRSGTSLGASLKSALIPLAGMVSLAGGLRKLTNISREFDVLNASLITATGSAGNAEVAFEAIQDFATTTPFALQEVTSAFVKLKNLGLTPSEAALTSYGNTAAAMGKSLNQTVEAVADAATGEFERLKEFGIRSKTQGDQVTFTFQGISTTVEKEASAIEGYLRNIGEVEFAGAMNERVKTLDGALSNLGDSWDKLFLTVSQQGTGGLIEDSVRRAEAALSDLTAALASGQIGGYFDAFTGRFDSLTDDIISSFDILNSLVEDSFSGWAEGGSSAADFIGGAFGDLPENIRAMIQIITVEIAAFVDKTAAYGSAIGDYLNPANWFADTSTLAHGLEGDLEVIAQARLSSIESILQEREESIDAFEADIDAADRARKAYDEARAARLGAGDRLSRFGTDTSKADALRAQAEAAAGAAKANKEFAESWQVVQEKADPVGAQLRSLVADIAIVQAAFAKGLITTEQADEIVNALTMMGEKAGTESAEAFINPWQSTADSVAQSLQDAIASGDWENIGDAVGNALATSISGVINKSITDSLAQSITKDSGTLAQMGAAFAGPIAGAIAGGAVQLAMKEVSDYLADDWDPTELRQAAQGTGTVLADMNAKSESIRRAVEGSESGIGQLVGINQGMLQALRTVQMGIGGASARVARGIDGASIAAPSAPSAGETFGPMLGAGIFGPIGAIGNIGEEIFDFATDVAEIFTLGLIDFDELLGGKSKKKDEGVQIIGDYISDMVDSTLVNAYSTFRVKKHAFDDYDTKERYQRLGGDVERQFGLVFGSIYDSVEQAALSLGMDAGARMNSFMVETQKISLEDLSADEKQAELEAYFGAVFDNLAAHTIPWLDQFQKAGEGLGETLARVANQTMVTQEAVHRLGIRFSDLAGEQLVVASERLMNAAGGVEQFITSMQGFIGNFATDAQKFDLAQSDMTRALSQANLQLPRTREAYYELLRAQNGATASGAENIATLLRLQGVADEYYTYLEDAQGDVLRVEQEAHRERIGMQRELLGVQRDVVSESLREAERASDAVARALGGLSVQGGQFEAASRERALVSLERMASAGRVGPGLDSAISAATSVQAGEFGSMNDYVRSIARTGAALTDLKWIAEKEVTREQRLLESIERRLNAMGEELAAVGRATAKHTAKSAKVLERIEMDGLEVRS